MNRLACSCFYHVGKQGVYGRGRENEACDEESSLLNCLMRRFG